MSYRKTIQSPIGTWCTHNTINNATAQRRTRTRWEHSPVIMAMLTGNTMNSCDDAMKLHIECLKFNSGDMICEAAARQIYMCMEAEEQKSIHHFGA